MSKLTLKFLTLSLLLYLSSAQISDKRLCVDPKCSSEYENIECTYTLDE